MNENITQVMMKEHQLILRMITLVEKNTGRLEDATLKTRAGFSGHREAIVLNAKGYAALLRGHIQKEDEILYPLAERILPETVRPRMTEAYEKANEASPDLEARYQMMIEKYEKELG